MKEYKQCQSCGMPLEKGAKAGTESDGSKSSKFCQLCFSKGEFLQPNISLADMEEIVDVSLREKGWWFPLRWMAKKQLPSLERWKAN